MIRPFLEQGLSEAGIDISEACFRAFELFSDELKKWNRKVNLTAINNDAEIAVKHIIDSLALCPYVAAGDLVLDIGSGAGFPAVPLKIVNPGVRIVSVDAVGKKINFQRHVARLLGFDGFEALHCRVENLRESHAGRFDLVVSRAFSSLSSFAALAAPLLGKDGRIIAMKGPGARDEFDDSAGELSRLGFEIGPVHDYILPLDMGRRSLVMLSAAKARV